MRKAIVTGSSGLLGRKLMSELGREYTCVGVSKSGENGLKVDISQEAMYNLILKENPEIIFHTAAVSDVDYCEVNQKQAWETNVKGTENIIKACERTGAKLIYISSDFVFDGVKGMYKEEDDTNPVNYYGKTKLEAEKVTQHSSLEYVIARPSVIYGGGQRKKFLAWIVGSLKGGEKITVVDDHYNTPTLVDNLVEMILRLIDENGVYHTSGSERINRYEFARKIARAFGLDESLIIPIKMQQLKQSAKRPEDTSLDTTKIGQLGVKPLNIAEALDTLRS